MYFALHRSAVAPRCLSFIICQSRTLESCFGSQSAGFLMGYDSPLPQQGLN